MHGIVRRTLERLVMLRNRTVDRRRRSIARRAVRILVLVRRGVNARNALTVHAERLLPCRCIRSLLAIADIRHIVARPLAGGCIPPDERMFFIRWRTIGKARSTVVEDMDVVRPRPAKFRENADIARVFLTAARRHVALAAIVACINPHAGSCLAVVFELTDAIDNRARRNIIAADFLHDILEVMFLGIIPRHELDGVILRVRRILIEFADAFPEHIVDFIIRLGVAECIRSLHAPLDEAHRVCDGAFAL